ncbi:class I SAM-dependent methyltransferase [Porticoccaceae bacterium]|nr:class I SAM-dependent methyltransferase [Porticoccaceae bacterium]
MKQKLIHFVRSNRAVIFWRKIVHTYLTPKFLWKLVIRNYNLPPQRQNLRYLKLQLWLKQFFWFWPTLQDSFFWRDVAMGEVMGPQDYVEITSHSKILVDELLDKCDDENRSFLDLGCNRGRFLSILLKAGMKNIEGVDVCASAIDAFREDNVEFCLNQSMHVKTIQEFLLDKPSFSVDIVYTHGATVELIPSSFPLVREICRVTRESVILYISETDYLYPRFWEYEFSRFNFKLTKLVRPSPKSSSNFSLFIFERR